MSHLSCRVGMGGIRELLDGKIWEWVLSFRWKWEWDGNGNEVIEMGGNWYEKSVSAHLYHKPGGRLPLLSARPAVTLATINCATVHPVEEVGPCSNRHVALWQAPNDVAYCLQLSTDRAGGWGCSDCAQLMTLMITEPYGGS